MVYKLNVTDHADELLDNLVYHLIYRLKNKEAAKHLLDSVESIYDRLVENPYQFPKSRDMYLAKKGYYEAVIPQMNYIVIFDVRKDIVLYASFCGIYYRMYRFTFNWYFVRKSAPIWNFILLKSIQSSDYYITKSGSGRI